MKKHPRRQSLLNRITWFIIAFAASLLLQIGVSAYHSLHVLQPMEDRIRNIQTISQFLTGVENSIQLLEEYRWDYGNSETLIRSVRQCRTENDRFLGRIQGELGQVSEDQYLLAEAIRTTYKNYTIYVDELTARMEAGDSDGAAALFYSKAAPCGSYLRQYIQQMLEQAILDNQSTFRALTMLDRQLKLLQTVALTFCLGFGVLLAVSLRQLLGAVRDMALASQAISKGDLDTPDISEAQEGETGDMARAFNEMKRSMKRQVHLLEEKNTIERALFKKEHESLEMKALMEQSKLQQLRSQINPHFLFNTLNVIMYRALQEKANDTHAMLGSLNKMFRYSLQSNDTRVTLAEEIQATDAFFSLYHARFGDRVRLTWEIAPEIDPPDTEMPSFLLQPLVENAFKHGLSPREEPGGVTIRIYAQEKLLHIEVADDGVGMSEQELAALWERLKKPEIPDTHIGVYNVAARLNMMGPEYGLDITSVEGRGTTASLRLPLVTLWEEDMDDEADDRG